MEKDKFDWDKLVKDCYEGLLTKEDVESLGLSQDQLAAFVAAVQALQKEHNKSINAEKKQRIENCRKELRGLLSDIQDQFDDQCLICGFGYSPLLQIHHKKPLMYGGGNEISNLCQLCPNCHALVHKCAKARIKSNPGLQAHLNPEWIDYPEHREIYEWLYNNFTPNQIAVFNELVVIVFGEWEQTQPFDPNPPLDQ